LLDSKCVVDRLQQEYPAYTIFKTNKTLCASLVNGPPPSLAEQLKIVLAERESRLSESNSLYSSDHNSSTSSFADEIREASLNCEFTN
jgi:hypothetical protein